MDARALITRLAEVIDAHDWEALPGLLHPDFTCRLVHTGEAFVSFPVRTVPPRGSTSYPLDVFAGRVERAPERWQKLGLEWLYRTVKEPARFKRIVKLLPGRRVPTAPPGRPGRPRGRPEQSPRTTPASRPISQP